MKNFPLLFLYFEIFSSVSSLLQADHVVVTSDASTAADSYISFKEKSLSLETLVDSRFKHLATGFQDQIDELKIKVNQLEAEKSDSSEITSRPHGLQKRQATVKEKKTPTCLNKTSICTLYFPDHPDAISSRKKFGGLVKNISSSARSLCTLYFPDHPDAYIKPNKGNYSALLTNEITKDTGNKETGVVLDTPLDAHYQNTTFRAEVTNKANIQNPDKQVKGMPTSCKDLQLLGHLLNGFYSVKTQQRQNEKITIIETVYCNFQASSNLKGVETRIGVVDIKSSPVHFSVSIKQDFYGKPGEKITFQKQVVNIGGGFDWENQWFLAPHPGTYFFSASGSKASDFGKVEIAILLNGEVEGVGHALTTSAMEYSGFSCQISIKLNANDKIELKMINGKVILLYFTGWMLEEDLRPFDF